MSVAAWYYAQYRVSIALHRPHVAYFLAYRLDILKMMAVRWEILFLIVKKAKSGFVWKYLAMTPAY
jgi:hypothetical protein